MKPNELNITVDNLQKRRMTLSEIFRDRLVDQRVKIEKSVADTIYHRFNLYKLFKGKDRLFSPDKVNEKPFALLGDIHKDLKDGLLQHDEEMLDLDVALTLVDKDMVPMFSEQEAIDGLTKGISIKVTLDYLAVKAGTSRGEKRKVSFENDLLLAASWNSLRNSTDMGHFTNGSPPFIAADEKLFGTSLGSIQYSDLMLDDKLNFVLSDYNVFGLSSCDPLGIIDVIRNRLHRDIEDSECLTGEDYYHSNLYESFINKLDASNFLQFIKGFNSITGTSFYSTLDAAALVFIYRHRRLFHALFSEDLIPESIQQIDL